MPRASEVDVVIEWCKKKRAETTRPYIVERNPFVNKYRWMMRFPLIEIDRPKTIASKTSLLYDSSSGTLWQYIGGRWMQIIKDREFPE